jgi:hypothetical protein
MTGLVALEFRRSLEHARERSPKLGCRQLWALRVTCTDCRSRTVGYSGVERAARRPVC